MNKTAALGDEFEVAVAVAVAVDTHVVRFQTEQMDQSIGYASDTDI